MAGNSRQGGIGFLPLYEQVKSIIIKRLADGTWPPGTVLPNEFELARELGVSQGTVRKAMDEMRAQHLLIRQQGRGTSVPELEESRILFHFFHLKPDTGEIGFPRSRVLSCCRAEAGPGDRAALGLPEAAPVWRIERVRNLDDRPAIVETISLDAARFAGLDQLAEIPNNVYQLYSRHWGITIAQSEEKLKAIAATPEDAARLECPPGTPLLLIERLARDVEGKPVEIRSSRCLTRDVHYAIQLH